MTTTIETKVSLPALIDLAMTTLGSAVYGCIIAFGWFHPTPQQNLKLGVLGLAIVLIVDKTVAYLAPHTPRPDLTPQDPQPIALTATGSVPLHAGRDARAGLLPVEGSRMAEPVSRASGD